MIDSTIKSDETDEKLSTTSQASTDIQYRPNETISHHRSNTIPLSLRKTSSNPQPTHLSPTYKRTNSNNSRSLLQIPTKQRIKNIDDDDDTQ